MRLLFTLLFVLVGMAVLGVGHYYVWARLVRDVSLPPPWPGVLRRALWVAWLSVPASFVLLRGVRAEWGRYLMWPIYIWLGMLLIFTVVLVATDGVRVFLLVAERFTSGAAEVADPDRRLVLRRFLGGAALVASSVLTGWSLRRGLGPLAVRDVTVKLDRLPRALDGFTIVQLTDIHFGPTIRREFAEYMVARANALAPDLIAITGDLVDGSVRELRDIVAPLGTLRARHGTYFVTGNHEYYVSRDGVSGADSWIAELARLGIRTLRNEHVRIGDERASFDLAGIDDWTAFGGDHGPDVDRAVAGRDPTRECVLLSHQPRSIHDAARCGVGLQLSGHTHGGQLWPWNHLVRLQQPYVVGLAQHGPAQIYVSPGTGYWGPPMRLGTEPEITRITLRAA